MELLHVLGHLYGSHGHVKRGATYLLIAAQIAPENAPVLRTLAHLLILDGEPDKALATIDRLESMQDSDQHTLSLLKSRALLAAGRLSEAKRAFADFLAGRTGE